jgi:hypothetical protein
MVIAGLFLQSLLSILICYKLGNRKLFIIVLAGVLILIFPVYWREENKLNMGLGDVSEDYSISAGEDCTLKCIYYGITPCKSRCSTIADLVVSLKLVLCQLFMCSESFFEGREVF